MIPKNAKDEDDVLMLWFQLFRRMINNLNNISNNDSKIRVIISQQLFSNDGIYNQNSNSRFDDNQFCFFKYQKNIFKKLIKVIGDIQNNNSKKRKCKKVVPLQWDSIKDLMKLCFELHMDRLTASNWNKTSVTWGMICTFSSPISVFRIKIYLL